MRTGRQHRIQKQNPPLGNVLGQLVIEQPRFGRLLVSLDENLAVLNDPDIRFTTTPESVMKYAEFMKRINSITHAPASWKELFFPEIHDLDGS